MNVRELREKLSGVSDDTKVVVWWEQDRTVDRTVDLFEIHDVSLATGTPGRAEDNGKSTFTVDRTGLATWLFISVDRG
jgi:hypothetical protein